MVDDVSNVSIEATPVLKKGKLMVNIPKVISEFENAMHRFPVKKVLYRAVFRGKGLEFDSYRGFEKGDNAELIDWKASLRSNNLLIKKYIEERNLGVYFLVDVSNSMLFGSGNKLKAEYAAELIAALSHLIIGAGDQVGLIMFSDKIVKILHPSNSKNQFALFAKFLSDSEFYGGGFDLDMAIDHVLKTVRSEYTVFIMVSDFIKVKKNVDLKLRMLGSRFEVMSVMIRDQMDEHLPNIKHQFAVQDPYSGRQMILDPSIAAEKYREQVIRQKGMLKDLFRRANIDLLELNTTKPFAISVSSFLKGRAGGF
ncbi:DUF58 domain-containing protein [archaeon]|mgnify:CR=1 FL=1|jgi:uncharacterized protein (DUF58 family)|nr:DUF58 domain-containing protein [archaeon]MBT3577693.1 DUF58 domain-containing protein [archaeon]MBT6820040.1 DUF58 domain-containing protein [archaeon]MBT7025359.1 DUF58 domain-containing protein [archaeon]MBT7238433.1 DUF58 domain-containing protein [archaeon]